MEMALGCPSEISVDSWSQTAGDPVAAQPLWICLCLFVSLIDGKNLLFNNSSWRDFYSFQFLFNFYYRCIRVQAHKIYNVSLEVYGTSARKLPETHLVHKAGLEELLGSWYLRQDEKRSHKPGLPDLASVFQHISNDSHRTAAAWLCTELEEKALRTHLNRVHIQKGQRMYDGETGKQQHLPHKH